MANKTLSTLGGILMLISIFLPTLYYSTSGSFFGVEYSSTILYWMFGYAYSRGTVEFAGRSYTRTSTRTELDMLGVICAIIILVAAVLSISNAGSRRSKTPLYAGILGILAIIIYIGGVAMGSSLVPDWVVFLYDRDVLSPAIGVFVCIIGGILSILGGTMK